MNSWSRASRGRATTLNRASSRSRLLVVSEGRRVSSKDERLVARIFPFIKTPTTIVVSGPMLYMDNLKAMLPNRLLSTFPLPCQIFCLVVLLSMNCDRYRIASGGDTILVRSGGRRGGLVRFVPLFHQPLGFSCSWSPIAPSPRARTTPASSSSSSWCHYRKVPRV